MTSVSKLRTYAAPLFSELRKRGILEGSNDPEFELALMPNHEMRRLKSDLLHKDVAVVDVLAFPNEDFPNPEVLHRYLGEVYVNEDIARDDHSRAVFLLIHGVLHLLGYRHEEKHDSIVMESLEHELHRILLSQ